MLSRGGGGGSSGSNSISLSASDLALLKTPGPLASRKVDQSPSSTTITSIKEVPNEGNGNGNTPFVNGKSLSSSRSSPIVGRLSIPNPTSSTSSLNSPVAPSNQFPGSPNALKRATSVSTFLAPSQDKQHFFDIVLSNNLTLVTAITEAMPMKTADELVVALVRMFEINHKSPLLLRSLITREVATSTQPSTIFRGNNLTTKMITVYCKLMGASYLRALLAPVMAEIAKSPASFNPHSKQQEFLDLAVRTVGIVSSSIEACPQPIRELCHIIRFTVRDKHPDYASQLVRTVLILRFFAPAIAQPVSCGLLDLPAGQSITPEVQSVCIFLSKTLQQVANGSGWPASWDDALSSCVAELDEFLVKVSSIPPPQTHLDLKPISIMYELAENAAVATLHKHVMAHKDEVEQLLKSKGKTLEWVQFKTTLDSLHEQVTSRRRKTNPVGAGKNKAATVAAPKRRRRLSIAFLTQNLRRKSPKGDPKSTTF